VHHYPYGLEPDDLLDSVEDVEDAPHFARHSITPASRHPNSYWKPRLAHPRELDDGLEPTWITWKISMEHKFDEDAPQFATEASRIRYVFSRTIGQANKLLQPYMKANCPTPFTTVEDMYMILEELFTDPGEVEQAKEKFRDLQMARTQSFAEFKMDFLQLAGLAEVPRASYVDELYNKLTDKLKDALAPFKYKWGKDFAIAALEIQQTDTRFTLNARQRQRTRVTATPRTTLTDKMATTSPGPSKMLWKPAMDFADRSGPSANPLRANSRPWTAEPADRPKPLLGKPADDRNSTPYPVSDPQKIKCHNCGKYGHVQRNCDQLAQPGTIREITEEELTDEDDLEDNCEDLSGKEHA
jgi:hypothetical protein